MKLSLLLSLTNSHPPLTLVRAIPSHTQALRLGIFHTESIPKTTPGKSAAHIAALAYFSIVA